LDVAALVQHRAIPPEILMAIANTKSNTENDIKDFHEQLKAILPRLRVYALSLTRDRDAADDLVHDTVVKALSGRQSFEPGTNLSAWVFRIQRNEFISGLRRTRPSVPVDSAIAESLSHQPHQESRLVMREFMSAFGKLASTQREALLLAVLEGQSYEVIAAHTGVSVGTVKSRISRARDTLERLLLEGDTKGRPENRVENSERPSREDDSRPAPAAG
jgi:RNA polymerase sigma-70 factor (ECF subfamily)